MDATEKKAFFLYQGFSPKPHIKGEAPMIMELTETKVPYLSNERRPRALASPIT
jgi:hypothetical protein